VGTEEHEDLDFTNTNEDFLGAGIAGGNTDHDESYWRAYDDGTVRVGHNTFVDSKDFRTTGEVRADDFYINDRVANVWNAEGFDVDVTDDVSITATNDIDLNSNSFTLDTTTSATITTTTTFDVDATGDATIASDADVALTAAANILLRSTGLTGVEIAATNAGSTLSINATNNYDEICGGALTVDGNTTVDDVAGAGVAHGRITSLDDLANNDANVSAIWFYS
jgi:hypothetical protein